MTTYSHTSLSLTVSFLVFCIYPISAASLTQQRLSHVGTLSAWRLWYIQKSCEFTEKVLTAVSLFYVCITQQHYLGDCAELFSVVVRQNYLKPFGTLLVRSSIFPSIAGHGYQSFCLLRLCLRKCYQPAWTSRGCKAWGVVLASTAKVWMLLDQCVAPAELESLLYVRVAFNIPRDSCFC